MAMGRLLELLARVLRALWLPTMKVVAALLLWLAGVLTSAFIAQAMIDACAPRGYAPVGTALARAVDSWVSGEPASHEARDAAEVLQPTATLAALMDGRTDDAWSWAKAQAVDAGVRLLAMRLAAAR